MYSGPLGFALISTRLFFKGRGLVKTKKNSLHKVKLRHHLKHPSLSLAKHLQNQNSLLNFEIQNLKKTNFCMIQGLIKIETSFFPSGKVLNPQPSILNPQSTEISKIFYRPASVNFFFSFRFVTSEDIIRISPIKYSKKSNIMSRR